MPAVTDALWDEVMRSVPHKPPFMVWLDNDRARKAWSQHTLERLLVMTADDELELRRSLLTRLLGRP